MIYITRTRCMRVRNRVIFTHVRELRRRKPMGCSSYDSLFLVVHTISLVVSLWNLSEHQRRAVYVIDEIRERFSSILCLKVMLVNLIQIHTHTFAFRRYGISVGFTMMQHHSLICGRRIGRSSPWRHISLKPRRVGSSWACLAEYA